MLRHKANILLILFLFIFTDLSAKLLIFTYSYNRPDFIEIQHKTFKRFLMDDYEFVVFNDASNQKIANEIEDMCELFSIRCIRIPQEIHKIPYLERFPGEDINHPSIRNCNVVQYSLNEYGFTHDDILVLCDSDLFLIKEFSIIEYLNNYQMAGIPQSRSNKGNTAHYLWIGLVFLNIPNLPNVRTLSFNCGQLGNILVDTGGYSHNYMVQNPEVKVCYFGSSTLELYVCSQCCIEKVWPCIHCVERLKKEGFSSELINFMLKGPRNMEIILETTFLHYRGGTNWDNQSSAFHNEKTQILHEFINDILK